MLRNALALGVALVGIAVIINAQSKPKEVIEQPSVGDIQIAKPKETKKAPAPKVIVPSDDDEPVVAEVKTEKKPEAETDTK